MRVTVSVPREIAVGERRVAMVPGVAERLGKLGVGVILQAGAGAGSFFRDEAYAGARVVATAEELYRAGGVILGVQPPSVQEIDPMPPGAFLIGFQAPSQAAERVAHLRDRRITAFAMELIPRIARAQSMDALSSQAAVAGYRAALMAAELSGRFFPMLTTAAGTIRPATVLVIGAGVAGLEAIATAKRLGAMVEAYDVRAVTREQVHSLGAKFLEFDVAGDGAGGYARELTAAEILAQQEMLARHLGTVDVVIATAAVPGRLAPRIISEAAVAGMKPGAVIVDLAAESGGNCALTRPGERIDYHGVTVCGPLNVPSLLPVDASEMYARNLFNFLSPMIKNGELAPDWTDEIIAHSLLTRDGEIVHEPLRAAVERSAA
jgi:H+-translocating NAD(P) transhydrogenase subunit alpha